MQELSKSKSGYRIVRGLFKKQFEIPEDWEYPRFSDVVKVNPRTKIDSKKSFYVPMEAVNIQNGSVDNLEERYIDENSGLPKFQKNDVLFARITPSTENGKICIIEDFPDYGIASSELTVLRPSSKVLPRYLFYFVQSHRIKQYAISQMMGTTGRQRVPDRVFKKDLNFELPPINEQLRIIQIISNIHSLIQKTDQVIEQTQIFKKGLMQRLLTEGIGHTKFKKTSIGEVPENWEVISIDKITKNKNDVVTGPFGSTLKKDIFVPSGYKIYGQENVIPDDFARGNYYISEETFLNMKKYEIKPKDILISLVGTQGKVSLVPDNIERGIINPRLLKITVDQSKTLPEFMKILLMSKVVRKQLEKYSHGLTMGILNTEIIKQIVFPKPPIAEQEKIVSILSRMDAITQNRKTQMNKLGILKKGLMQKLLTGKIRAKV